MKYANMSKAFFLAAAFFITGWGLSDTAEANFSNVTPSSMKYGVTKYWRKKAEDATLGSVGEKMMPAASKNYFQKIQDAPSGIYDVTVHDAVTIETQKANAWGVQVAASNGSVAGKGQANGKNDYKGKVTAYKMVIDLGNTPGDLRYETNRHINHLNALKELGNKGRLISSVWIFVEGEEEQKSCYSGKLTIFGSAWKINTKASGCKNTTYTISPGSIFAYEMVKADKWDKEDKLAYTPSCPKNYPTYEVRKSTVTPMDRCKKTTVATIGVQCKLAITDKRKNWYVEAKSGRDICKSKKGKPNKSVECTKNGYNYVAQSGKDSCTKQIYTYQEPVCKTGYVYNKKSTSNAGKDICELKGISHLKVDNQEIL